MKDGLKLLTAIALSLAVAACADDVSSPQMDDLGPSMDKPVDGDSYNGNGAPSGPHYNLNLIGVPKDKSAEMDGNNGHRIFVKLYGNTKILLTEGPFAVLDANGTDNDGAAFQLPNPDPDGDGITEYSVFVRGLGKPNGSAQMQTCYTDATGSWCAVHFVGGVEPITVTRGHGQQKFVNVSKDLLYVDYCAVWENGTCTQVRQIPLFGEELQEYFWSYDNSGLKLAQLRFYEIPTDTGW